MVIIGIDPHKSSFTAVAVNRSGATVGSRRFVVNAGTATALCEMVPPGLGQGRACRPPAHRFEHQSQRSSDARCSRRHDDDSAESSRNQHRPCRQTPRPHPGHHPIPLCRPLRRLHRHRSSRRVERREHTPPAQHRWQSSTQFRAAHHRRLPSPRPGARPRLLPAQTRRGQDTSRSPASTQTPPCERPLSPDAQGPTTRTTYGCLTRGGAIG